MIVMPFSGDFLVFDNETTGLLMPSPTALHLQPFITEFYGIRINKDWEVVDEFETFVKPPIPIPDEVVKITRITDEMVADAPTFVQVVDRIIELFLGVEVGVAHNATFDMDVIRHELERIDLQYKFPWPPKHHCTVELSKPIENKMIKLDKLYEIATGKPRQGFAHRAKKDVMDTVTCYRWLIEQGFVK